VTSTYASGGRSINSRFRLYLIASSLPIMTKYSVTFRFFPIHRFCLQRSKMYESYIVSKFKFVFTNRNFNVIYARSVRMVFRKRNKILILVGTSHNIATRATDWDGKSLLPIPIVIIIIIILCAWVIASLIHGEPHTFYRARRRRRRRALRHIDGFPRHGLNYAARMTIRNRHCNVVPTTAYLPMMSFYKKNKIMTIIAMCAWFPSRDSLRYTRSRPRVGRYSSEAHNIVIVRIRHTSHGHFLFHLTKMANHFSCNFFFFGNNLHHTSSVNRSSSLNA